MSSTTTSVTEAGTPVVDLTKRLEESSAVDPLVNALRPVVGALVADPDRRDLLQGKWLGHAVHPLLTDVPIGFWTSSLVLDLVGGPDARGAARKLVGLGVLSFVPTALTGWAEWSSTGTREQRVGVVHAVTNAVAAAGFLASWRARRRGEHARGVTLSLASAGALGVGGYLGAHLVSARKVSSRHPAYAD
jgi:uncharacterized membrane protein